MMTKMHYYSTRVLALSKCHIMVQVIKFLLLSDLLLEEKY